MLRLTLPVENVHPSTNVAMVVHLRNRLLVAARKIKLSLRRRFGHGGDGSVDAASAFGAHGFLYDMDLQRVDDAAHANLGAYSLDCC